MIEIERKFLLKSDAYKKVAESKAQIAQGYLNSHPERIVRIRVKDEQGFITIKGKSSADGTSRFEWEQPIAVEKAKLLLDLCEPGAINKTRYFVKSKEGLMFEVDEFYGDNQGLRIAEIELPHADYPFEKPDWLGEEVTQDPRYYNAYLTHHPYNKW